MVNGVYILIPSRQVEQPVGPVEVSVVKQRHQKDRNRNIDDVSVRDKHINDRMVIYKQQINAVARECEDDQRDKTIAKFPVKL